MVASRKLPADLVLLQGAHPPNDGMCAMEAAAYIANEAHSDHPQCFPAGTVVSGPAARSSTLRWYEGEMVELIFASGKLLSATPNHPILTSHGWIAAGAVYEGCDIICGEDRDWISDLVPNEYQHPALIEDVAAAVGISGEGASATVPVAAKDFHGDGSGSKVTVIRTNRLLRSGLDSAFRKPASEKYFIGGNAMPASLSGYGSGALLLEGHDTNARRRMCSSKVGRSFFGRALSGEKSLGVRHGSTIDTSGHQDAGDNFASYSIPDRKSILGFASTVTTEKITQVRRYPFAGHVHNLETETGWYIANGVIVHNCVCPVIGAFLRSWNDAIQDDAERTRLLKPLLPHVINTKSTSEVELARAMLCFDWSCRECLPTWLSLGSRILLSCEVYGSPQDAALLRALFQSLRLGAEQRRELFSAALEFECLASWIDDRFPGEGRAKKYRQFAESLRSIEACANGGLYLFESGYLQRETANA